MGLWKRHKADSSEPRVDPALERAQLLRRNQWKRLQQHLTDNTLFRQTTFDGLFWIDPFTGQKINAPFDWLTTAKEYFGNSDHWRKGSTKAMVDLRLIKWTHHLNEHFWNDERYRLFVDDGRWFNPFTRSIDSEIRKDGNVISRGTVGEIAHILAKIPHAEPSRLPSLETLLSKHPELSPQQEADEVDVTIDSGDFSLGGTMAHTPAEDSPTGLFHGGITGNKRSPPPPPPVPTPTTRAETNVAPTRSDGDATIDPNDDADQEADHHTISLMDANEEGLTNTVEGSGGGFHDANNDLEMAARVQQQLLGDTPQIDNIQVALHCEPCHYVGGDFYDFIKLKDGRWFILLGDVSGHGVQAALVVQSIIKTLRFVCMYSEQADVIDIMATVNDSIKGDLLSGQFFTCFAGILDARNPEEVFIEAACCGHHPSIVVNAYGPIYMRSVGTKGMAVGLSSGKMMRTVTTVDRIDLAPGDCLFVWTDGLSEAMSPDEEEFGDWRTRAACIAHADFSVQDQVDGLVDYVLSFCNHVRQDDMSVFALRVPHPDDCDEHESAEDED